jgi:hypothetical protein
VSGDAARHEGRNGGNMINEEAVLNAIRVIVAAADVEPEVRSRIVAKIGQLAHDTIFAPEHDVLSAIADYIIEAGADDEGE